MSAKCKAQISETNETSALHWHAHTPVHRKYTCKGDTAQSTGTTELTTAVFSQGSSRWLCDVCVRACVRECACARARVWFYFICFYYWKQWFRTLAWGSTGSTPYGFESVGVCFHTKPTRFGIDIHLYSPTQDFYLAAAPAGPSSGPPVSDSDAKYGSNKSGLRRAHWRCLALFPVRLVTQARRGLISWMDQTILSFILSLLIAYDWLTRTMLLLLHHHIK